MSKHRIPYLLLTLMTIATLVAILVACGPGSSNNTETDETPQTSESKITLVATTHDTDIVLVQIPLGDSNIVYRNCFLAVNHTNHEVMDLECP